VESNASFLICNCGRSKEGHHVECAACRLETLRQRAVHNLTVVKPETLPEVTRLSRTERQASKRRTLNRRRWWTRARVIEGLRRWYRDYGTAPLSTEAWHALNKNSGMGPQRRYPSFFAILSHFASFREAWTTVGVEVNRGHEEWTALEDWYLLEAIGILSRVEIARDLNRTADAVHRRIYDLGQNSHTRLGWSIHRLSGATGVPEHTFRSYMAWGDLPFFRGTKINYVDPGDLTMVTEIDFEHLSPELEQDMLRALRTRLVKVLAGRDWRANRLYKSQPSVTGRIGRDVGHTHRTTLKPVARPNDIQVGEYVRVIELVPERSESLGRIGLVHRIYPANRKYSYMRTDGSGALWMARVEFKSCHNRSRAPRVTMSLPLSALARVSEPVDPI
jgi:hypothetical protein